MKKMGRGIFVLGLLAIAALMAAARAAEKYAAVVERNEFACVTISSLQSCAYSLDFLPQQSFCPSLLSPSTILVSRKARPHHKTSTRSRLRPPPTNGRSTNSNSSHSSLPDRLLHTRNK